MADNGSIVLDQASPRPTSLCSFVPNNSIDGDTPQGSHSFKAGIAGEDVPRSVFFGCLGKPYSRLFNLQPSKLSFSLFRSVI
jgi:hypothetical protein